MKVKKILKFSVILVILTFLIFGFVCTGAAKHTLMHDGMNSVAIMQAGNQQECCNTSIAKYIESLKNTPIATSRDIHEVLVLFILGIVMIFALGRSKFRFDFTDLYPARYKLYERNNPNLILFNGLKLAFARGILNSKVF
jgi:outer membrane lipoprotein-sorting protein